MTNKTQNEILDYRNEGVCSNCGYGEEAHINRGYHYNAIKPGKDGAYKWKPCKRFKPKMTKMKTGMFWHVHHNILCEYCWDYGERVEAIKRDKPKNEVETRLRLFKPVKGKLPIEFLEVYRKYFEADKKYDKACKKYVEADKKYDEACKKYFEADNKYVEAYKKYLPKLEKFHKKVCGCSEWNGKEIVFK